MDDARPRLAADAAQIRDVMEQRVDERARRVAGAGMHDHAGRLVQHGDVGVLVQDLERQRLRPRGATERRPAGSTVTRSPSCTARLGARLRARRTVTWPSAISFWICERECSARTETRKRSRRWPVVIGGNDELDGLHAHAAALRRRGQLLRRLRCRPRQPEQHDEAERRQHQRDELRRREDPEHRAARIAAVDLDDVARDGVQKHVGPEGAARKRPAAALGRQQHDQDEQLGAGLVELRRMQRNAERRADVGGGQRDW